MRKIAVVLCLVACSGGKSKNATPKGTNVLDWNASKSTREAYKTATFENRTAKDDVIAVRVCTTEIKLKLHLETATAKYIEANTPMEIGSLASLVATVEDG